MIPLLRRAARPLRLLTPLLLLPLHPAAGQAQLSLIPQPREVTPGAIVPLRGGVRILRAGSSPEDRFAGGDLAAALKARGIAVATSDGPGVVTVMLSRRGSGVGRRALARNHLVIDSAMGEQGYVLAASGHRVDIVGGGAAGVFYGVQTLKQLIQGSGRAAMLQTARIRDWPALRWRGVHDDLSRGPVPTLEFQKKQIRTLGAYKINVFSPYFEHTLAYQRYPLLAPPGGAMSEADVRALVAYARDYHVTIIPEQEAFGHLHHVLKWELYSSLGETPHGHVLAPGDSGTLGVIGDWFDEIDSLFPGPFVHIGADETFELGRGRTAELVRSEGLGAVYLDFLRKIEQRLRPRGKRLLFWGDVAGNSPELVKSLPHDMIAVAWNYWSHDHFDRMLQPFIDAGMDTWVAPGVANWSRVWPDYHIALPNIQQFVLAGQRLGSEGVLNTTWDDDGEALFNQTWYGLLFGAAASWQAGEADTALFARNYGPVFQGDASGEVNRAQQLLIQAHALLDSAGVGDAGDWLFWLDPWSPAGQTVTPKILPVASQLRLLAEGALVAASNAARTGVREPDALAALELGARRIDFIGMKFQFADEIARAYRLARDTADAGTREHEFSDINSMNGRLQDLRDGYTLLRGLYRDAWLRENRPYWLQNVLARYDAATALWLRRMDQFTEARRLGRSGAELPAPAALGLPDTSSMEKAP